MRSVRTLLLVCSLCFVLPVLGEAPPEVAKLQENMPPAVAELIARMVDCNHWQGEEPYDADRAKQIEQAISGRRCAALAADVSAALKTFGRDPRVRSAIATARQTYL